MIVKCKLNRHWMTWNKFWRFYYDFEEERLIWEDKENLRNVNEKLEEKTENTRLNSVNSRT